MKTQLISSHFHYLPHRTVVQNGARATILCTLFNALGHYFMESCLNDIPEEGP